MQCLSFERDSQPLYIWFFTEICANSSVAYLILLPSTLKSTSVSLCLRGISRLPSAFDFLRSFKLAHISIQAFTFHDGCKQGIDQFSDRFLAYTHRGKYISQVFNIHNFGYNMVLNVNVHVKVLRYFLFCDQHVMSLCNLEKKYFIMFQPVINII